jgi:IS30 family transposase
MTEIGRELGKNKQGISRELKRNGNMDGSYNPWPGTSLCLYRRKSSVRKPCPGDAELPAYIRERLGEEFRRSPECVTEEDGASGCRTVP